MPSSSRAATPADAVLESGCAAPARREHRPGTASDAPAPGDSPVPTPVRTVRAGVLGLALFFLFLAGILAAADRAVNHGLRTVRTGPFGATNRIVAGEVNADIVITGSSRAFNHYDPSILATATGHSVYNLGRNGSQTDLQVAVLKTYLRHNAKPKLIIHNLDLFSFLTSHEIYDPAQYVPYLDEPALYTAITRVYPDAWKWKYLPLYGYVVEDMRFTWVQGLAALVGIQPRETMDRGFQPRSTAWTGDFERFKREHPNGVSFEIEPRGRNDLAEILAIGRRYGIPVVFVYSPEYRAIQSLQRNRSEIFARFTALCAAYHAPLWDYSESTISGQQAYFYNSQHLNAAGAAVFSADLGQRLVASGLLLDSSSPPGKAPQNSQAEAAPVSAGQRVKSR